LTTFGKQLIQKTTVPIQSTPILKGE